jgi:hypothetical protein
MAVTIYFDFSPSDSFKDPQIIPDNAAAAIPATGDIIQDDAGTCYKVGERFFDWSDDTTVASITLKCLPQDGPPVRGISEDGFPTITSFNGKRLILDL